MRILKIYSGLLYLWFGLFTLLATEVIAMEQIDFNNMSLKGTYASMGIGRGGTVPAAGMTIITADGKGKFVGKTVFNRPGGELQERLVVTFPIKGSYEVNPDGSGTLNIIPPGEVGEAQGGHFMITAARVVGGRKNRRATEVSLVLDKLLPNSAALQTAVLKRLPRRGEFSNSSVKGTYASMGIGRGGVVPVAGLTTIDVDGEGNFVGKTVFNRPGAELEGRVVVTFPIAGTIEVNQDGSGIINIFLPPEVGETQSGHFMITRARVAGENNIRLATEVSFILDELLPNSAALQTSEFKRLSD